MQLVLTNLRLAIFLHCFHRHFHHHFHHHFYTYPFCYKLCINLNHLLQRSFSMRLFPHYLYLLSNLVLHLTCHVLMSLYLFHSYLQLCKFREAYRLTILLRLYILLVNQYHICPSWKEAFHCSISQTSQEDQRLEDEAI